MRESNPRPDEYKSSGKNVRHVLEQESGVPITPISPEGRDKVARARSTTVFIANRRVLLRSGMAWLPTFLSELTMFPDDEHDDQVDAFVYAVLKLLLIEDDGTVRVFSRRRR